MILLRALSLSFSSSIAHVSILKHESHANDLNFLAYLEFNVQSFAVCCSHFWALFLYGFNLKARFQSQNNNKSINVWVFGVYGKLAKQLDNFTWTLSFIWCFFFVFYIWKPFLFLLLITRFSHWIYYNLNMKDSFSWRTHEEQKCSQEHY